MRPLTSLVLLLALASIATPLAAQSDALCPPAVERGGRTVGCAVLARNDLGRLLIRPPLYWHIDVYSLRSAAEHVAHADKRSTVVEAYGKVWLFTIAPFEWRSPDGERWGTVGPLRVEDDVLDYRAVYVQGALDPFLTAAPHRHDGAERSSLAGRHCARAVRTAEPGDVDPLDVTDGHVTHVDLDLRGHGPDSRWPAWCARPRPGQSRLSSRHMRCEWLTRPPRRRAQPRSCRTLSTLVPSGSST